MSLRTSFSRVSWDSQTSPEDVELVPTKDLAQRPRACDDESFDTKETFSDDDPGGFSDSEDDEDGRAHRSIIADYVREGSHISLDSPLTQVLMPLEMCSSLSRCRRHLSERWAAVREFHAEDHWKPLRKDMVTRLLLSLEYESTLAIFILLNCLTLGLQAHQLITGDFGPGTDAFLFWSEQVFTFVFLLEVMLRAWVYGAAIFVPISPRGRSNFVDFVLAGLGVVLSWIIPLVVLLSDEPMDSSSLRTWSVLRVFRLVRLLRVFHRVPLFREAWQIVRGLSDSMRTLFWTCVVIFLVTYIFAVFGLLVLVEQMQVAKDALPEGTDMRDIDRYLDMTAGLDRLMYTLVQVLTMDSFHELTRGVLVYVGWSWIYFYAYIGVGCFVLMNLVTAVMVENAMAASKSDHEHEAWEKARKRERELRHLQKVFQNMDTDGGGTICWEEFKNSFRDPSMRNMWRLLDLHARDCRNLFKLLDNGDGEIGMDEFFEGLKRVKGEAQARDLFKLQKDLSKLSQKVEDLTTTTKRGPQRSDSGLSRSSCRRSITVDLEQTLELESPQLAPKRSFS